MLSFAANVSSASSSRRRDDDRLEVLDETDVSRSGASGSRDVAADISPDRFAKTRCSLWLLKLSVTVDVAGVIVVGLVAGCSVVDSVIVDVEFRISMIVTFSAACGAIQMIPGNKTLGSEEEEHRKTTE